MVGASFSIGITTFETAFLFLVRCLNLGFSAEKVIK